MVEDLLANGWLLSFIGVPLILRARRQTADELFRIPKHSWWMVAFAIIVSLQILAAACELLFHDRAFGHSPVVWSQFLMLVFFWARTTAFVVRPVPEKLLNELKPSPFKNESLAYRLSVYGFCGSFVCLMLLGWFAKYADYLMVFAALIVSILVLSAITFVLAIASRDLPRWKQNNWRFSIRDLLIAVTIVAMALGGLILAARSHGAFDS